MPKAETEPRSSVFETFLTSLEKSSLGISDRPYADQLKVQEMAKFVWNMAPWRVFSTFTFKFEASVQTATKCFERFVRQTLPNVSVFFVIELHPLGHGGHVHALFDRLDFPRIAVWKAWKKRYGINRIEPINGFQNVCDYVSKYVVKDHAWWNFALTRSAWGRFCNKDVSLPLSGERNFGGMASQISLTF